MSSRLAFFLGKLQVCLLTMLFKPLLSLLLYAVCSLPATRLLLFSLFFTFLLYLPWFSWEAGGMDTHISSVSLADSNLCPHKLWPWNLHALDPILSYFIRLSACSFSSFVLCCYVCTLLVYGSCRLVLVTVVAISNYKVLQSLTTNVLHL